MENLYTIFVLICLIIILYLLTTVDHFQQNKMVEPKVDVIFDDKESKYQDIKVVNIDHLGKCLFIGNELQLTDQDEHKYHEMMVHFPAQYLRNNFERVIIIGGGDLMGLREVMKYPSIKEVYILELDPAVINTCVKHFNSNTFKDDKRVKYIFGDASETIKKLKHKSNTFDLCIVDTTEDNTSNLTIDKKDFFQKCLDLLNPQGLLVKNGGKYNIPLRNMDLFPQIVVYNLDIKSFGGYTFNLCSKSKINDLYTKKIHSDYWKYLMIKTKYYNVDKHFDHIVFDYSTYIK